MTKEGSLTSSGLEFAAQIVFLCLQSFIKLNLCIAPKSQYKQIEFLGLKFVAYPPCCCCCCCWADTSLPPDITLLGPAASADLRLPPPLPPLPLLLGPAPGAEDKKSGLTQTTCEMEGPAEVDGTGDGEEEAAAAAGVLLRFDDPDG
jgi:hypothetical protein